MKFQKLLLIIIPILTFIFVLAFLILDKPQKIFSQQASVIQVTAEDSDQTDPSGVKFSDEAVSNTVIENELRLANGTSSAIAIESKDPGEDNLTIDLVTETSYLDNQTHRSVSYQYDQMALINQIHAKSNNLRAQQNLPELNFDPTLAKLAIERSTDMARLNYLSHTSSTGCDLECRFKESGFATMSWGENLAEYEPYTTLDETSLAKELVERWAASSEHRRNLMSSTFTHHGVGVATNGNRIVVTVIFAQR